METQDANYQTAIDHDLKHDLKHDLDHETDATLRFLSVGGIGPGRVRALCKAFSSAACALQESPDRIAQALRVSVAEAASVLTAARAADPASEREKALRAGTRIVGLHDAEYPQLLRASPDPPALLFVRGELSAAPELGVAIVGSRKATAYGCLQAGRMASELAARGVTIVSGGARGIDAQAHRGALRAGGRTIAVLAAGSSHPYPPEHASLFDAIIEAGGAVITEQCSFVEPRAEMFPRRNRIVAALSLVVIVIEAAHRSGALVTARIAVEDLSRDVGCMPGPVDSPSSEGCHRAIREGWAQLITNADDVCELLREAKSLALGAAEHAAREAMNAPAAARPMPSNDRARRSLAVKPLVKPSVNAHAKADRTAEIPARECTPDGLTVLKTIRALQRAGLDELEGELGWPIQRIAVVTLELETSHRIERDREGAFRCVGRA